MRWCAAVRRAARTDANQAEIVKVLRSFGCTVWDLSSVGDGGPDIAVGYQGRNWFFEIKDGDKPPSASSLNAVQRRWHTAWRGQVAVVRCVGAALDTLGIKEWKGNG